MTSEQNKSPPAGTKERQMTTDDDDDYLDAVDVYLGEANLALFRLYGKELGHIGMEIEVVASAMDEAQTPEQFALWCGEKYGLTPLPEEGQRAVKTVLDRLKTVVDDYEQYDHIKPLAAFKPLGPISHVEIQPVREYESYCEPCEPGKETFWSVYVRYDPSKNDKAFGGVDCIADCSEFKAARNLASLIAGLLGVPVAG
jgi:hypothetical protein